MSDKAVGTVADSSIIATGKQVHRSRVTNGTTLHANKDGRSTWARRMRDLMQLHISDLGGDAMVSRTTVRKVIRSGATAFAYEREVQPLPKLGPWRDHLDRMLTANTGKPGQPQGIPNWEFGR